MPFQRGQSSPEVRTDTTPAPSMIQAGKKYDIGMQVEAKTQHSDAF